MFYLNENTYFSLKVPREKTAVCERSRVKEPWGPSTLATLFNHMWPRIVADPSTLGRHVAATCMLCMQTLCLWRGRATACRTLEPQTAVCSPKLENNGFLRE